MLVPFSGGLVPVHTGMCLPAASHGPHIFSGTISFSLCTLLELPSSSFLKACEGKKGDGWANCGEMIPQIVAVCVNAERVLACRLICLPVTLLVFVSCPALVHPHSSRVLVNSATLTAEASAGARLPLGWPPRPFLIPDVLSGLVGCPPACPSRLREAWQEWISMGRSVLPSFLQYKNQ